MKDTVNFAFLLGDVVKSCSMNEVGRVVARMQCADEGNSYRVRYAHADGDTLHVWYPEAMLQIAATGRAASWG